MNSFDFISWFYVNIGLSFRWFTVHLGELYLKQQRIFFKIKLQFF